MDAPQTHYAMSGDVHIAYQMMGEGPVDLVFVQGAFSHLGVSWKIPAFRRFCQQISSFCRLIWFDKRGMGLSERVDVGTLDERMDDVRAVMDACGSPRAILLGASEGGPLSLLFAAAHPERTAGLILAGAEVKERLTEDWPWGESTVEQFNESMERIPEIWGTGLFFGSIAPSLKDEPGFIELGGELQLNAATPRSAVAFMRMAFDIDVRAVVPTIDVPTLVLHRTDDPICHVENGRFLAANIPGAIYKEFAGSDHAPWSNGGDIMVEIREFVTGIREPETSDRVLATVLLSDIVGSTQLAAGLGDEKWRNLLDQHDAAVREQLRLHRGHEVNTTGDGFIATFDGPTRAIRCALAIIDATTRIGATVRIGLHTGECELRNDDVAGLAVHVAARIGSLAGPGQILVSRTVTDLVAGSGISFADEGHHELKGLPGAWDLFSVTTLTTV